MRDHLQKLLRGLQGQGRAGCGGARRAAAGRGGAVWLQVSPLLSLLYRRGVVSVVLSLCSLCFYSQVHV